MKTKKRSQRFKSESTTEFVSSMARLPDIGKLNGHAGYCLIRFRDRRNAQYFWDKISDFPESYDLDLSSMNEVTDVWGTFIDVKLILLPFTLASHQLFLHTAETIAIRADAMLFRHVSEEPASKKEVPLAILKKALANQYMEYLKSITTMPKDRKNIIPKYDLKELVEELGGTSYLKGRTRNNGTYGIEESRAFLRRIYLEGTIQLESDKGLSYDVFGGPLLANSEMANNLEMGGFCKFKKNKMGYALSLTPAGEKVALSSFCKVGRDAVIRNLLKIMDQVREFNKSEKALRRISRVTLFGSFLTSPLYKVGDVDIALTFEPVPNYSQRFDERREEFLKNNPEKDSLDFSPEGEDWRLFMPKRPAHFNFMKDQDFCTNDRTLADVPHAIIFEDRPKLKLGMYK